ncbi:ABC transporter permease [Pseudobacillus wudalianchiensis]|uniref:Iron export ABC transporter permease subunit FetB n=1 Tax=Pseudobacillus wudalianchiensis TaxID=1743143 RepID=A0A1B9AIQ6_9BACI|nr:iron export ABC transporter permease subunit FetB [Bacillus wudalianchiensis]OCA83716.1 iron export ABC transporter permease subunit FetB [Bacillus wudalianchiensis]
MSLFTLSLSLVFVGLAILLSNGFKLGLEKDIVIATVRSSIQLLIIGYVLTFIFSADNPFFMVLMILLMILAAAQNIVKKKHQIPGLMWRVIVTLLTIEAVTMLFLMGLNIIPPAPRYVITFSGMIIGSSMVIANLFLNRLRAEVRNRKEEIAVILSLGGTAGQAMAAILKDVIRASMIPTIESTKTMGLVQLPGMMTGQIIGGADPAEAVRFQLVIVFSLLAAAALTSIILSRLVYPALFNEYEQLIFKE